MADAVNSKEMKAAVVYDSNSDFIVLSKKPTLEGRVRLQSLHLLWLEPYSLATFGFSWDSLSPLWNGGVEARSSEKNAYSQKKIKLSLKITTIKLTKNK